MIRDAMVQFACAAPKDVQEYFVFPDWTHHLHVTTVTMRQAQRPWYHVPCEHHVALIERRHRYDIYLRPMPDDECPENDHSCAADDAILRVASMLSLCRRGGQLSTLPFDERTWSFRIKQRALRCDVLELTEHLVRAVAPVLTINEITLTYASKYQRHDPQWDAHLRYLTASRSAMPPRDFYHVI